MAKAQHMEFPDIYPYPKQITLTGGDSDLSLDIRLVTSNVSPLQRKAVRSVLTMSGVRVVANKKKYVIDAQVLSPEDFDLSEVPEACRKDFYELRIQGSEVYIRAPEQDGTVYAAHTLAAIYKRHSRGEIIPNLVVRDWPHIPMRGIFVENKWGPDRMTEQDWMQTIDTLASFKMNVMGIGLYGCWGSCRFEGVNHPTEFLMVPVPEHDELKPTHTLRWYSPNREEWREDTYLPTQWTSGMLNNVVEYGKERGVTIIPFVNSYGHNTYFARMIPEISAKDAQGKPTGVGYCINSPKTREFVEKFYSDIIDRYFGGKLEYFHIQMDEVWPDYPWPDEPCKDGSPICKCKRCKGKKPEDSIQDYVIWLVKMLTSKGVKKVVMWNDQLSRHMDILGKEFANRLAAEGLKDKLILHWWWYSNQSIDEKNHVSMGRKLGINGWVAPMTCYYDWSTYDYRLPNIELMMRMADKEKACGAVSYAVHNPSHIDHEALLAGFAWESTTGQNMQKLNRRWAQALYGANADTYLKAMKNLTEAAQDDTCRSCMYYSYSYVSGGSLHTYPKEPLEKLEALAPQKDPIAILTNVSQKAAQADALFQELLADESLKDLQKSSLCSLRAHSLRLQAVADIFRWLLELRANLASGMVKKSMATACAAAREEYVAKLALIEKLSPTWLVPSTLQALSVMVAFLDQLLESIKLYGGKKKASALSWAGELPPFRTQEE